MEGKTRFSRSKVPLYALEIWFLCIPFCHAQVYEAARASWLASGCLHVPVCGGTPQRDGAQRNRAAWQNGNCTERYGGTPQRDGIELRDSENPEQILNFRRKSQMKIYEAKNYEEMSRKAASILASQITLKPDSVLGLATGSTPIGLYDCLVDWYEKGDLDFSQIKTVNLDEYKGLNKENDQSYYYFMHKHLFDRVNINPENTNVPDGTEMDSEKECTRYEEVIRSMGGVDIQLLGLGNNGHIGFNEPDSSFAKMTHCVDLTESTIEANKRFFASADDVPRQAYSMGIGTIMRAKKILLVANGEAKADALAKCLFGPVTPEMPGSILQFHNDVVVVADSAALSKIPR